MSTPRLVDWPKSASPPVIEPYSPITSSSLPEPAPPPHPASAKATRSATAVPTMYRDRMGLFSLDGRARGRPSRGVLRTLRVIGPDAPLYGSREQVARARAPKQAATARRRSAVARWRDRRGVCMARRARGRVRRMPSASRAGTRRAAATWQVAVLIMILAAGCGPRAPVVRPPGEVTPPPPPPPFPAIPGYEAMVDTLANIDASGLAGRRIALDPGHGGFFRGALGVHGLTEAEVNLAVALKLRDLLVARGAIVFMTRDTDRDFLTPADSSLKADLTERVRLANAFAPDLFVSIHHNADAGGAHNINETQPYYKLGDSGPSLDVAQDVHRGLVRNVGIRPHKVVPGNYSVLRNSDAPGILTETSYITNPAVEDRLRLPEKQQIEAEALFVGLARYFGRPVPVIADFRAVGDGASTPSDTIFVDGDPVLRARVTGSFDDAAIEVDGGLARPERVGDRLAWRPVTSWAPGAHDVVLRVRLAGVGAARERRLRFHVVGTPATLVANTWPEA